MLEKTKAIVLHQIKYSDSGIIVQLYTRKFGRRSVMIKGMRKKKTGKHGIMFQPMFILDVEMYYKPDREIQTLKEFTFSIIPLEIHSNIRKSSVALFLGEVLSSVLKEESPHEEMFDFMERSITWFDSSSVNYANFHIAFLAELCTFLGIQPTFGRNIDEVFFDLRNGRFVPVPPMHGDYASEKISEIISSFFSIPLEHSGVITLSGQLRNELLEILVRYYSIHLPSLRKINSLEVLKEVFM